MTHSQIGALVKRIVKKIDELYWVVDLAIDNYNDAIKNEADGDQTFFDRNVEGFLYSGLVGSLNCNQHVYGVLLK